jgi:hypothetical protein
MRTPSIELAPRAHGPEASARSRPSSVAFALLALLAWALVAPTAACSSSGSSSGTSGDAASDDAAIGDAAAALTWHRDVRPIVEARCAGCHVSGGFAPFALKSYGDAFDHRDVMAIALAGKLMPPWPPNDACNAYTHDRSITDAQRATLVDWARGPAVEGDPATFVPLPAEPLTTIRADKTLRMSSAYTPAESPDEYRCFVMDWNETTTKYVTGLNVRPGLMPIVHHAIAFLIQPADVGTVTSMDAADPAPGYKCFGGVGINGANWLGAWAPGAMPSSFPASSGLEVVPGSKVVVQIHYNTASAAAGADQTSVDLQLADSVATKGAVMKFANPSWVVNHTMTIKAGDADSVQSFTIDPSPYLSRFAGSALSDGMPFRIHSAALHMHNRGVKGTLKVLHADGTSDCALRIDDWSFHWQGTYELKKALQFVPGDQLAIECHFDNSGGRQPLVSGAPVPVADANWGETTEDEMCLGVFYVTP